MKQKSIFVTLLLALVFAFSNAWAQERGVYDATTMGELVVNLETAPYGQDTPYNSLCPNMGTVNAKTGCGPTAFTILCQYHKWPETGVGTSEVHQGEAIDFSTHTYDYDNMRNDNYPSGYTEAQANAVAMMMRDFGWAHKVDYGSSVTKFSESIKGLKTYFSYNNSRYNTTGTGMDAMYRSDVGDEKFIETLKACLDEGLPIPFSALSIHPTTKENNGRHIFILDGYTENNYFHFNFGWNGMGNGWYKLDNVQPDDESDYSTQQRAYPWITPTRTSRTVTASVSPAGAGSVTVNGNSSPAMVTEGTYATLTATANSGYTFSHWSKNGTQVGAEKTLKTKVEAEGNDYVANFLAVGTTRVNVSVSYNSNYGTVAQNGNAISGTGLTPYQNTEVTLVATPLDGYVFNGWTVTVGTTSTKYTTTNLTFVAKENASVYADFSLATQTNTIDLANGTLTNDGQSTSKFSQWAAKDNFTNLKLNAAYNGTALNAISTTKLYAGGYDANSNPQIPVTYTISVDEKYVITSYSISYTASSADVTVTANGAKMARSGQVFAVTDVNSNRTSFVVNSTNAQHNIEINSFTVETKVVDGESSGTVTPTTYTISVTATEGGSAYVGTGTSTTVTAGNSVMLTATANNGYTFDGWYNGTNRVSTDLQYTFTPTASGSYQARFTANATPDQPTIATNLAGKYFRLKTTVNDAAKYLNVADNNPHTDGGNGGVSVATLNESSNAQIFYFEASGDGYKLKDKNGYYIKGQEWNVDANTTNAENASVLLFEETTTANEYYIKWNNTTKGGIRYFKVGASSTNASNYYPYGDEADKTKAAVWVLEEVVYYTITATAGEGGSVSPATSTVEEGNSVTLTATASTGYYFVNWTKNGVEVSTDATYSFTATEITSLVANFEQIVVNVTLTDAQGNTYNVQLSGFTTEITEGTVAAKLTEKYPYITLGDNATLDNAAYTYSNKVTLPFKVSSVSDATKTYWHNIYYPSNNTVGSKPGCPNYIAAFNNDDDVVDMAASGGYAYGADPTYNTKAGNPKISWAVYSVKNSFEFVFKNELTNKYIKVGSVSSSTTNNVKFVENAEDATTFTLLEDTDSYNGDYALVAKVGEAEGYLCATSSSTNYVTYFSRTNHQGAWVKFVEAPDYYSNIMDLGIMLGYKFGAGDGKYIITDAISEINDRIANNSENITLNTIKQDSIVLNSAMNNWPAVRLTINPVEGGTTNINGEENVVHKYVPNGYELPLAAVPAVGYHFVSWTDGTSEVETAEYTKTISGTKGDVIALTANFAKDTYTINVSTNGTGGSAMIGTETSTTVEHGASVTINAVANDGYKFSGWYNGEEFVSAEANYTFTVTSDVNYTAKYEEQAALPTYAVSIETVDAEGNTLTNNATGQVKAIINNVGQSWATAYDFVEGSDIEMVAVSDYNQQAYLFEGWYKNNVPVSNELKITVQATEAVTYQARFVKGCVVTAKSNKNQFGYATSITLVDGTSIGYDATNRAVVKSGTTVRINTTVNMIGYHVKNWVKIDNLDVQPVNVIFEGEEVGTEQNLVVEINEDAIFGVNFAPVIYVLTVSTEQSIMGSVNAMVGTSYSGTSVPVECGQTATIVATPAEGYKFVKWTKDDVTVSTSATYTVPAIDDVTAMNDVEYVAVFEEGAEEPVVDPFLTACYRLRWKSASNQYLNVNDHDTHEKGTYGGVSVADKDENSNAQIFFFEASGDGYKLKDKNGYYIKGQEWNVDANTTNAENASVLLFEETTTANEYYIKWNNTADKYNGELKYFKVGYATNTAINFPYCDASKADAAVWVLEKVADIISYTVTDETGNKYSGTYLGTAGVDKPTFTGVYEYELTNEAWNGVNYTADIVFPVPLENVMILPFEGSTGIRYYVDANNNVKATKTLPGANATAPALDDYLWKFEPLFNNGKFTFKIKSVVKNAYMTTAKTTAGHGEGYVKISTVATDTPMEFTIAEGNRLKIEGLTNLYLSTGSSSNSEQYAGVYGYTGSHGNHTGIINKFSCKDGTYRVVDNAGNVHEGEYDNYIVTFNGAYGYTLSDVSYNADVFEATINLPFTVSKEGETPNEILLAIYSENRYLHAVGNNVKVQTTNVAQVDINCLWAIYPECENGNFKFAIKNVSNGKYIYSAANDEQNILQTEGTVMLSTIPSKFEYIHDGSYEGLKFADRTKLYLSINGQNDTDVLLGVHKAIHKGTDIFSPSFNSYGVTIGNAGYATFYAEKAVNIPTDVEAYYLVEEGINASERYVSLTKLENGVIPAGEAVVLKAEKGTYTFEFNATSTETIENNLFEGTVAATYIEDDAYVLSVLDGEIGLYLAWKNFDENYNKIGEVNGQKIDSKYFLNNGHKIYLPKSVVPSAAALSAGFRLMFGTTAIEEVEAENGVETIYDLAGRKLESISGSGIYIVNGKKVVVR